MNEGWFKELLVEIEEQRVPATLDLWPEIQPQVDGTSGKDGSRRRVARIVFSFSMILLGLSVLLVALSPGLRNAAAQAIREIEQLVGIAGDSKGPGSFYPSPPFIVKLPGYLPEGFEYVSGQYNPGGENLPSIQVEVVRPGKQTDEPATQPAAERDSGSQASILVQYQGDAGRYFELFERKAQIGEMLAPGEDLRVNGEPARLQRDGEKIKLTWIEAGTWIELSGELPTDILLQIAAGLITTQMPEQEDLVPQALPDRQAVEATERAAFCNPEDYVPDRGNFLGDVPSERRKGSIRIDLFYEDKYPLPATVAWGSSVENHKDEVFIPALQALKDPESSTRHLPYKAIGMYTNTRGCMEPNPALRGYFVIEVWDKQVNIGYGGDALALRDLAVQTLEQELEGMR